MMKKKKKFKKVDIFTKEFRKIHEDYRKRIRGLLKNKKTGEPEKISMDESIRAHIEQSA